MPDRSERSSRALWQVLAGGLAALAVTGLVVGLAERAAAAEVAGPAPRLAPETGASLSLGCGQPPPAVAPSSIEVGGRRRGLITVVPTDYRPERPYWLVLAFHGRTNSNAKARGYFRLEGAAPAPVIFVYPSGLRRKDGTYSWAAPDDPTYATPDLALFDAVVAKFSSLYCIDRTRVFAVGHSLGAWYANSLGCARGDVLRGIGTIAGALDRFPCRGRVAAMLFHNPRDRHVSYRYGLKARDRLRAEDGLGRRARRVSEDGFACRRYGPARARNPVLWCPYTSNYGHPGHYYPHHWPHGAGRAILDFFASLPGAGRPPAVEAVASDPPG